ncbi:hypothetical protein DXG03_004803, partial [Asterophora parasitica]
MLRNLPPEIVVRILCYLDLADLASAARINKLFHSYTKTFQVVQYHIATQAALLEDNPSSKVDVSTKLGLLASREEGWAEMDIDWCRTVKVEHRASGVWDLTGGYYLLGNESRRSLHYFKLPSAKDDPVEWSRINMDCEIIDLGLNIDEHDLIATFTKRPHLSQPDIYIYEIHFRQFSTGEPHPLAQQPVLFIQQSGTARPSMGIEIVGDHLALVITWFSEPNVSDQLYVFDWRTGALKLDVQLPNRSYISLVFLSPTLLLLPNARTCALDVWDIPAALSATPAPLIAFALPELAPRTDVFMIQCRGEPNPTPSGKPHSTRPFTASADDAVLLFHVQLHNFFVGPEMFVLFAHRGQLREMAERARKGEGKWAVDGGVRLGAEDEEDERAMDVEPDGYRSSFLWGPGPFPEEDDGIDVEEEYANAGLEFVVDYGVLNIDTGTNSDTLHAESSSSSTAGPSTSTTNEDDLTIIEDPDFPLSTDIATLHDDIIPPAATHSAPSPAADPVPRVPWTRWGPRSTRWVNGSDAHLDWITASAGTRGIVSLHVHRPDLAGAPAEEDGDRGRWLEVLDFNPYTVRRYAARGGGRVVTVTGERDWGGTLEVEVVQERTTLRGFAFRDPVSSALPFVRTSLLTPSRAERRAEQARAMEQRRAERERVQGIAGQEEEREREKEEEEEKVGWEFDSMLMDEERLLGLK